MERRRSCRPMMKRIAAIALVLACRAAAVAQSPFGGIAPVESSSGQFLAYAAPSATLPFQLAVLRANTNYIYLEPTLLAISCERIKQALWNRLGMSSPWRGRVYLRLHPARSTNEVVTIVSDRFSDGWSYWVELPDLLPRDRFVQAIIQVLLREYANRGNRGRAAAIPAWLAVGLTRELPASSQIELVLSPPTWRVHGLTISPQVVSRRWSNPLKQAKQDFDARRPLTFEQLSWPAPGQWSGQSGELYGSSAQLFVHQLLLLRNGAACLRAMLDELPRFYNWQLAFLKAFHSYFQTPLEVEKWWALQVVHFTGRDLTQTWTPDESARKLDDLIHPRVDVRTRKDQLPLHAKVSLQAVLRDLDTAQQRQLLHAKIRELDMLRVRVAPDWIPIVDDYRRVLQTYLDKLHPGISINLFGRRTALPAPRAATIAAIRQLDALDARRAALRAASALTGDAPARSTTAAATPRRNPDARTQTAP